MKSKIYLLLFLITSLVCRSTLKAQCIASVATPSTTQYVTIAYKTSQSFTPTCSGQITGITFKFSAYSDDFRGSHAFLKCNLKDPAGTILARAVWPNGKDTTELIFPNNTITAGFVCTNISLSSGTKYSWELEAVEDMPNIIPQGGVILFAYSASDIYNGGNYIADAVQKPTNDIQGWTVTMSNGSIATANSSVTQAIVPCGGFYNAVPQLICNVDPGSVNGIAGSTTARVWIETAQPANFVKRHYEITPTSGAANATGRVTLYFSQAEFDAFNSVNTIKLPTGPGDAAGKSALLIEKRAGMSSNGTGLPGTYTGTPITINPADADVVWNNAFTRWEITFDVTGFSGFFVKTSAAVLPLKWLKIAASKNDAGLQEITWLVEETNVVSYRPEKSFDGIVYRPLATVSSVGNGTHQYNITDPAQNFSDVYYRVAQTDVDGKSQFSSVVKASGSKSGSTVFPTLFKNRFTVIVNARTISRVINAQGQVIMITNLSTGNNYISGESLAKGMYILMLSTGEQFKIIKE